MKSYRKNNLYGILTVTGRIVTPVSDIAYLCRKGTLNSNQPTNSAPASVFENTSNAHMEQKLEECGSIHVEIGLLGPVAASRFSSELDQVGRRELVHDDCALHHYYLNSISLELQFKPEPAISSDQALNSAFLHK